MLQIPFTVAFGNLKTISTCYALIFNNCVGNDKYTDCSNSFMLSAHLRRKKGLLMPSAWEHRSSELYLLVGPLVLELI